MGISKGRCPDAETASCDTRLDFATRAVTVICDGMSPMLQAVLDGAMAVSSLLIIVLSDFWSWIEGEMRGNSGLSFISCDFKPTMVFASPVRSLAEKLSVAIEQCSD